MDRIIGYEPIDSGSNPDTSIRWPLRLMVRTAASQAANVEFESRRGHYGYRTYVKMPSSIGATTFFGLGVK